MPFKVEVPGKLACEGPDYQHMIRFFHHEPGRRDGVEDAFDRGHCAGAKLRPLHEGGIHPLHPIQLSLGSSSGVEEARLLEKTDRGFDRDHRSAALAENRIAGRECLGKRGNLRLRHRTTARASVSEDEGTRTAQLRRRSRAFWYAGSLMRSKSDLTKPRPVTQSSKFSESFLKRGGSPGEGLSPISATMP